MDKKVTAVYFSPTGNTKTVVMGLAARIATLIGTKGGCFEINFTPPAIRQKPLVFSAEDIVVVGVPVYAGRVPNVLLKYLASVQGDGAMAVAVVAYGHRAYDDALIELADILTERGFQVIGGGAFLAEHSLSRVLAPNRPDAKDMAVIYEFANRLADRLVGKPAIGAVTIKGNRPYRPYYAPVNKDGSPVRIKAFKPVTNSNCIDCKLCAQICPMGAIDYEEVASIPGICIKCGACIKKCPTGAKYFDNAVFMAHIREIEEANISPRKEPEYFV